MRKVIYKKGGKVHCLDGATSSCGIFGDHKVVSENIEVTCIKCKKILKENLKNENPDN